MGGVTGLDTELRTVNVELGERRYPVLVGPGARHRLSSVLPRSVRRAAVITQAGIPVEIDPGIPTLRIEIPRGETSKSLSTVEACHRRLAEAELSRSDVVIGLGGGLVTDLAGLVAALWHRGTAVVHVATTLLAQVDAAVGGKSGVNLPEGKNLVGAFHEPAAVLCDTEALASLPEAEWRSGRGEIAKYELLGVPGVAGASITEQIFAAVTYKAAVVAVDEREQGARKVLNYGHTLAHALEAAGFAGYDAEAPLRHGEAVGIGLVFAARLAQAMGRIGGDRVEAHEEVVRRYGLPTRMPSGADPGELVRLMRRDKKAHGDLTFVLDGPQGVEPVTAVDAGLVTELLVTMGEDET